MHQVKKFVYIYIFFFCEMRGHLYSKFNNVALPKMSSELEPEVE
jgi:hypothetical protein